MVPCRPLHTPKLLASEVYETPRLPVEPDNTITVMCNPGHIRSYNSIEKSKVAILHMKRDWHHRTEGRKVILSWGAPFWFCPIPNPAMIYAVWEQAIIPKNWPENFPATKFALLFMARM